MRGVSFVKVLSLAVALSGAFVLGSAYPSRSSAQSQCPKVSKSALRGAGQSFVAALNNKDVSVLRGLCDREYLKLLRPYLNGAAPGHCRFVDLSQRSFGHGLYSFQVEWKYKKVTRLVLVTVKEKGAAPLICFGPVPK